MQFLCRRQCHSATRPAAAARSRCTSPLRPVPKPGASGDSSAMRARPRVRSLEACSATAVGGGDEFRRVGARPRRGKSAGEQESPLSSSGRVVRTRESARRWLVEAPASRRRPRGVAWTGCGGGIDAGRCARGRRGGGRRLARHGGGGGGVHLEEGKARGEAGAVAAP